MGTLGLCPLELSRTVLLGRFARGGAHKRDARLPRKGGKVFDGGQMPDAWCKRVCRRSTSPAVG
jgi:hypothetical protein